MEELIPIIIVFVVSSVVSSLKKHQKAAEAQRRHAAATSRMQTAAQLQTRPQTSAAPARPVADVPGQVMMPTVHPHVQPDCDTHDAPGSLGVTSTEGKDPCHAEQLDHLRMPEETTAPEQGGLTFSWTGSDLVKAVVMQEVLTRPANRAPIAGRRAQ